MFIFEHSISASGQFKPVDIFCIHLMADKIESAEVIRCVEESISDSPNWKGGDHCEIWRG